MHQGMGLFSPVVRLESGKKVQAAFVIGAVTTIGAGTERDDAQRVVAATERTVNNMRGVAGLATAEDARLVPALLTLLPAGGKPAHRNQESLSASAGWIVPVASTNWRDSSYRSGKQESQTSARSPTSEPSMNRQFTGTLDVAGWSHHAHVFDSCRAR